MENKDLGKNLDDFLSKDSKKEEIPSDENQKTIKSKDGLIERIDRKLVTQDGKMLLREVERDNLN